MQHTYYVVYADQMKNRRRKKSYTYFKVRTKWEAEFNKDQGHFVFRREPGIPNPRFVRRLLKDGSLGKLRVL